MSTNYRGHARRMRGFGTDAACPVSTVRGTRRVRLVLGFSARHTVFLSHTTSAAVSPCRGPATRAPRAVSRPSAELRRLEHIFFARPASQPGAHATRKRLHGAHATRKRLQGAHATRKRLQGAHATRKRLQWSRKRARGAEGLASGPTAPKRCMRGPPFRAPCSSPSCSTCAQSPPRSHLSHACFPHPAPPSPPSQRTGGGGPRSR